MVETTREIDGILNDMEAELRRLDLWEPRRPSSSALLSPQPFCFDTLTFTQWLQWVFIPKVRGLVAAGAALPDNSDIYPMAEHVFDRPDYDGTELLALIGRFDSLINRH